MRHFKTVAFDPNVMGGTPCIRGVRGTVGTLVGLFGSGAREEEIRKAYPYLTAQDIKDALEYAAWRTEEVELPLVDA